jgi:beta-galactosidase/beta-glucuronidase
MTPKHTFCRTLFVTILATITLDVPLYSQDWKTILDLQGVWKIELGDDVKWAEPKFDDAKWDNINVPSPWEEQGYPGYDGYAWYRKHFWIGTTETNPSQSQTLKGRDGHALSNGVDLKKDDLKNRTVFLRIGYIDDVSETYVNGHLVGIEGEFPPHYSTAYDSPVQFPLPVEYLNFNGDNVIAVRVYDDQLAGGITHGRIGLFEPDNYLKLDYSLAGVWKFTTGDNMDWMNTSFDTKSWKNVVVPSYWETQGFKNYDGLGWYRLRFRVPKELEGQRLILLLGKIDDVDETYLNGELVGKTGHIHQNMTRADVQNEWQELRAYVLPSNALLVDQENVLAVRVSDVFRGGGIYEGPVGLVTRERYLKWKRAADKATWKNLFDWFK